MLHLLNAGPWFRFKPFGENLPWNKLLNNLIFSLAGEYLSIPFDSEISAFCRTGFFRSIRIFSRRTSISFRRSSNCKRSCSKASSDIGFNPVRSLFSYSSLGIYNHSWLGMPKFIIKKTIYPLFPVENPILVGWPSPVDTFWQRNNLYWPSSRAFSQARSWQIKLVWLPRHSPFAKFLCK